jgi:chemotaxis protein MotB
MSRLHKKFEEEHEEHIDESWLIPYADILTLLLALFIVLFASSEVNNAKFNAIMDAFKSELSGTRVESHETGMAIKPPTDLEEELTKVPQPQPDPTPATEPEPDPEPTKEELEHNKLMEQLKKFLGENNLQNVVTLTDTKRGVEISLKDVVLFSPAEATLKPSSFTTLDAFVKLINALPNPISIEGHTDNVPIGRGPFASNWELSAARAVSVLHYFEEHGIDEKRLHFVGYGEFQPISPNDTNENRQANRRVNIVILKNLE